MSAVTQERTRAGDPDHENWIEQVEVKARDLLTTIKSMKTNPKAQMTAMVVKANLMELGLSDEVLP